MSWNQFFSSELKSVIDEQSFEYKGYRVTYNINTAKLLNTNNASKSKITPEAIIQSDITIENTGSLDSYNSILLKDVPLVKLPLLTDNGFMIRGTRYNCLNEVMQADGWYILNAVSDSSGAKRVLAKTDPDQRGAESSEPEPEGTSENSGDLDGDEKQALSKFRDESSDSYPAEEEEESLEESLYNAVSSEIHDLTNTAGSLEINALKTEVDAELRSASEVVVDVENVKGTILHYRAPSGGNLTFYMHTSRAGVCLYDVKGKSSRYNIPWFKFFRAIYPELSVDEIYNLYSSFDVIKEAYSTEMRGEISSTDDKVTAASSSEDCARQVLYSLFGKQTNTKDKLKTIDNPIEELFRRFNDIKSDTKVRNTNLYSFVRLNGLVLSRSFKDQLSPEDKAKLEPYIKDLHVGQVLTKVHLVALDKCKSLTELYVKKNNKEYKVPKPDVGEYTNFVDEVKDMFYNYMLAVEGVGSAAAQDAFENKIVVSIEGKVKKDILTVLANTKNEFINTCNTIFNPNVNNPTKDSESVDSQLTGKMTTFVKCFRIPVEENYKKFLMKIQSDAYFQSKDDTNSMGVAGQFTQVKYAVSKHVPDSVRSVRDDQYGLICPYSTSEGANVGLNLYLTIGAKIIDGVVKKQFYVLRKGKRIKTTDDTWETTWLSAGQISRSIVALAGTSVTSENSLTTDKCNTAYIAGDKVNVTWELVEYEELHQAQNISLPLSTEPNFNNNGGKRGVMTVSTTRSIYPILAGERSFIDSGTSQMEEVGIVKARIFIKQAAAQAGIILEDIDIPEDTKVYLIDVLQKPYLSEIKYQCSLEVLKNKTFTYEIPCLVPTIKMSLRIGKIVYNPDNIYKPNDIIVYLNDVDITTLKTEGLNPLINSSEIGSHGIGIGRNLKVAFLCAYGHNYEDAMIFNESIVGNGKYAIARLYTISDEVKTKYQKGTVRQEYRYGKLGERFDNSKLDHISEDGLPVKGTFLQTGDVIIAKTKKAYIKKSKSDPTLSLDKTEILRNDNNFVIEEQNEVPDNIYMKQGKKNKGYVIHSGFETYQKEDGELYTRASVTLLIISNIQIGDKFTGGHGNKGVMAKILPRHKMPFVADTGEILDIILNTTGVLPRENLGQIIECVLNAIGQTTNTIQVKPPFTELNVCKIIDRAEQLGLKEVQLINAETGRPFDRKAFVGTMCVYRSEHDVQGKYNAEGGNGPIGPNLTVTRGNGGGQRCGEQSAHALMAAGCTNVLDSITGIQGNDVVSQQEYINNGCQGDTSRQEDFANSLAKVHYRMIGIEFEDYNSGTYKVLNDDLIHKVPILPVPEDLDSIDNPDIFGNIQYTGVVGIAKARSFLYSRVLPLHKKFIYPEILESNPVTQMAWVIKDDLDKKSVLFNIFEKLQEGREITLNDLEKIKFDNIDTLKPTASGTISEIVKQKQVIVWIKDVNLPFLVKEELLKPLVNKFNLTALEGITMGHGYAGVVSTFLGPEYLTTLDLSKSSCSSDRSILLSLILTVFIKNSSTAKASISSYDKDAAIRSTLDIIFNKISSMNIRTAIIDSIHRLENEMSPETSKKEKVSKVVKYLFGNSESDAQISICPVTYRDFFESISSSYFFVPPLAYRRDMLENMKSPMQTLVKNIYDRTKKYTDGTGTNIKVSYLNEIYKELVHIQDFCIDAMKNHETKNAILRDNTLSRRIHWSGRGYVIVDPDLDIDQIKVPLVTAVGLFESHLQNIQNFNADSVLYKILLSNAATNESKGSGKISNFQKNLLTYIVSDNINAFFKYIFNKKLEYSTMLLRYGIKLSDLNLNTESANEQILLRVFDRCKSDLKDAVQNLFEKYPIGMERAPALSEFSNRCFNAILSDGYAIGVSPSICGFFNMDFDGDQVLLYLPITNEARQEAREILMSSSKVIDNLGNLIPQTNQDMIAGVYWGTCFEKNKHLSLLEHREMIPKGVYRDINTIQTHLETGILSVHDFIIYKHNFISGETLFYKDTVGRILFCYIIPNSLGFTNYKSFIILKDPEDNPTELEVESQVNVNKVIKAKFFNTVISVINAIKNKTLFKGEYFVIDNSNTPKLKLYQLNAREEFSEADVVNTVMLYNQFSDLYISSIEFTGNTDPICVTKSNINLVEELAKASGHEELIKYINNMRRYGFYMVGESGLTISLFDFKEILYNEDIKKRVGELKRETDIDCGYYELGFKTKKEYTDLMCAKIANAKAEFASTIEKMYKETNPYHNLYILINSGARGTFESLVSLGVMLGMSKDAAGEYILRPSFDNYCKGLSSRTYYDTAYNVREALKSSALSTGKIGEVARQLAYTLDSDKIDDTDLSEESVDIYLNYDVQLPESFSVFRSVLVHNDKGSNPIESNWDLLMDEWEVYKSNIHKVEETNKIIQTTNLLKQLLQKYGIRVMYYTDGTSGQNSSGIVKYKLTKRSKALLLNRSIDLNKLQTDKERYSIDPNTLPTAVCNIRRKGSNTIQLTYNTVTKDTLKVITYNITTVLPIFLAMNCSSHDGICAKCYGRNANNTVPERNVMVGLQSAHAIGQTVSQVALDAHKSSTGNSAQAFALVKDILRQFNLGVSVGVSQIDGIVSLNTANPGSLKITIVGSNKQFATNAIGKLLVEDGDYVKRGDLLYYNGTLNCDILVCQLKAAGFNPNEVITKMKLIVLNEMLNIFSKDSYAKQFDILLHDLLKFGIANTTKLTDTKLFVKGELYPIVEMQKECVPCTPIMVSTLKSQRLNGKTAASQAMSYLKQQAGADAVLERKSVISSPLCGMMRSLPFTKLFSIGKKEISEQEIYKLYENRKYGESIHTPKKVIIEKIAKLRNVDSQGVSDIMTVIEVNSGKSTIGNKGLSLETQNMSNSFSMLKLKTDRPKVRVIYKDSLKDETLITDTNMFGTQTHSVESTTLVTGDPQLTDNVEEREKDDTQPREFEIKNSNYFGK